ncbi:hypothetical protein ES705_38426 [subsurface metagenome]
MARKSGSKRLKPKMNTQRFLYYDLEHSGTSEDAHYIDLAKDLSAVNRRMYRQGRNYSISNISVHDSQGDARVVVSTAPNSWAIHEAWQYCFDGWKHQRAEVLKETAGLLTPRWADFKVYLNKEHVVDSDWPLPTDDENNDITLGEWDYSDMSFFRGGSRYDNYAVGLMGQHSLSAITNETTSEDASYDGYISAIDTLQESRSNPTTFTNDGGVTAQNVFSLYGGAQIVDALVEIDKEGDEPPYSLDFVSGSTNPSSDTGAWPVRECHIASTYSPMAIMGAIPNVPCGLLQIETASGTDGNIIGLLIELTPGSYKGVHAPPMGN